MSNLLNNVTQKIADANKTLATSALIAQAYATSVTAQQKVDLPDLPGLKMHKVEINKGLGVAQTHANNYLNNIQPRIIQNVVSIGDCYNLLSVLPTSLLEGSTVDRWLHALNAVKERIIGYKKNTLDLVVLSGQLDTVLKEHSQVFLSSVRSLNADVNGDDGPLEQNKALIKRIEEQIGTDVGNMVLGAIGEIAGVIIIGIGCCAPFVTGGAAAGLVVAGVIIVAGSSVSLISNITDIVKLQKIKNELISDDAKIKPQVQLALGISTGYQSFVQKINNVQDAATRMRDAWELLVSWVDEVIDNLEKGLLTADGVRAIYLGAIKNKDVTSLTNSIGIIETQMTGVGASMIIPDNGESVGEAVEAAARKRVSLSLGSPAWT